MKTEALRPSLSLAGVSDMAVDCPMVRIIKAVCTFGPATESDGMAEGERSS